MYLKLKRFLLSIPIALMAITLMVSPLLAAPSGNVTFTSITATATTITLKWAIAAGSTSTVIRWRTDTFPTSAADGTSAYSGSGYSTVVSGLTAGTTYYFSAWGYDGIGYSPSPAMTYMTTTAVSVPGGGIAVPVPIIPPPTIPASANATANITGFNLEPFTTIIRYFLADNATSPGGLGMPENNAWEMMAIGGITLLGIGTYTRTKQILVTFSVIFLLTIFAYSLHLVQWYLIPIEIVVGIGSWAIERNLQ